MPYQMTPRMAEEAGVPKTFDFGVAGHCQVGVRWEAGEIITSEPLGRFRQNKDEDTSFLSYLIVS
jgi:hypothetical protein